MRLVLASNNAGKLAELQTLFGDIAELLPQRALGIGEADEPHATFIENALAKARHVGTAAVADDSGLCVDALGGAPGVASAVYAPAPDGSDPATTAREDRRARQDAANNALLLQRLHGVADRRCAFVCTLVALRAPDDPEPLVAVGRWPGEVLTAPRGTGGFGYDPLVYIPGLAKSVAELAADEKNAVSHRALAARRMRRLLADSWHLGR